MKPHETMDKNLPYINSTPANFNQNCDHAKNLTSKSRNPSGKAFSDGNGPLTTNLSFLAPVVRRSPMSMPIDQATLLIKLRILDSKSDRLSTMSTYGCPTQAWKLKKNI